MIIIILIILITIIIIIIIIIICCPFLLLNMVCGIQLNMVFNKEFVYQVSKCHERQRIRTYHYISRLLRAL